MKTTARLIFMSVILTFALSSFSQDKKVNIGTRFGVFVPTNWMIQGYHIKYIEDGSTHDLSVSGFGNGAVLGLYGQFLFKNQTGIMLDAEVNLLQDHYANLPIAPSGDIDYYENRLTVFPINLYCIQKIKIDPYKIIPYVGVGAGIYISEWETKHYPEDQERTWMQGNANPIGFKFVTGFDIPIYHDLLFNFQFDYAYVSGNWTIKNVDNNEEINYDSLNTGGTGLKFGISYRF